ncbi:hypothetical protein [Alistipes senegalensis]|nr:hypothetical protein [Alistipes senegalensis]MDY4569381.1 hypothetical protein [Alistipes senegalensis]
MANITPTTGTTDTMPSMRPNKKRGQNLFIRLRGLGLPNSKMKEMPAP